MKRVAILILLFVFLFNSVGYLIVFKTVQYQAKKEIKSIVKNNLSNSDITKISINRNNLSEIIWIEEGKEFLYKNKLYDLIKSEVLGDELILSCIDDKKETQLFANLDEQVNAYLNDDISKKNSASQKIIKSVLKVFYFNNIQISFAFGECNSHLFACSDMKISDKNSSVFIPPPEIV